MSMSKRKSTSHSIIQDTRALSEVLGALIVLALLLSASSIYLARHVPEWTEECEARHAAEVPRDFAQLTADIDRAILSGDPTSTTSTPIGMIPEVIPLVGMYASGGTLRFNQSEETFECIAGLVNESEDNRSGCWNNTANWTHFINDSFHVRVFSTHAELAPIDLEDKIIDNKTESLSGEHYYDEFIVRNNSTLTVEGRLKIYATTILVDNKSSITADGKGWAGGLGNSPGKNGSGMGGGKGGANATQGEEGKGGDGGGGGGGGGKGGDGGDNNNSGGTASYEVDVMGAGGGGGGDYKDTHGQTEFSSGGNGGRGGGYIWLEASNITIAGCISANGTNGLGKEAYGGHGQFRGGGGGGGAGGGIVIKGHTINLTGGMLYARGGNGGSTEKGHGGGSGGGGVINISFEQISPDAGTVNSTQLDVSNGSRGTTDDTQHMENGDPGFPGLKTVEHSSFTTNIFHYTSGYLVSNMTAVQGQLGFDTNSTHIRYGNLTYGANLKTGTDIVVKVRTSMYPDMRDAVPWEDCPPAANGTGISDLYSVSDGHRYIQWLAELLTFDPQRTPELNWVNITYDCGEPELVRTSGMIEFASQYLYYPDYQLIYAHGATMRKQQDGSFMLFEPPLFIQSTANGTQLSITAFNLIGCERAISGRVSATVQASYQDATLLKRDLNYANVTLKLTTGYPDAWARWFNETCREAGLAFGTAPGEYATNQTGDTLQITFYGNESKPVKLWLKRANVRIELFQ
jgi:hypothetical protein